MVGLFRSFFFFRHRGSERATSIFALPRGRAVPCRADYRLRLPTLTLVLLSPHRWVLVPGLGFRFPFDADGGWGWHLTSVYTMYKGN
jgi:hypothetical protein